MTWRKRNDKKDSYLVESDSDTGKKKKGKKVLKHQTMLLSCPTCCTYFTIFLLFLFYIIIYTIFTIYYTFYSILSLNMLEILQILLLIFYKLVCYQSQKIISNIYSLYFLSNTNHIFTPSVCKFFSYYELVIFVYLF